MIQKERCGKRYVLLLFCMVLVWMSSGDVQADVTLSQNEKIKVDLYGQINRAVLWGDDGDSSEFYHVDNDNSSSRVGIKATAQPNDKLTVGAVMEFEYQANPSDYVWQGDANAIREADANKFEKRILDVFLEGRYGRLTLGHGCTASDNSAEVDLSGTTVVGTSKVQAFAGGMRFFDNETNALDANPADPSKDTTIKSVFNNLDGLSRADRIRYDTPRYQGFQLSVSSMSENRDDAEDAALGYTGEIAGGKVAAAVAYANYSSSDSKKNQFSGSASFLAGNGLNLTVSAGNREHRSVGRADANFYFGKIGYIADLFTVGTTAFAVDYGTYGNVKKNDDRADTVGALAVQSLKDWGTELYLGYRHYVLSRVARDYEDVHTSMAGIRIKF